MQEFKVTKQDEMYLVSQEGEVFSRFTNKILKPSLSKGTGYLVVNIRIDGKRQPAYIHRLVAEAFIPNPDCLPEVNHKDGDKTNCRVNNLEWVTGQGNKDHAKETGLTHKGSQLKKSKLDETQVHIICALFEEGFSTGEVLKFVDFSTNRSQLLNIRARRDWKHVSGLYNWESHSNKRNCRSKQRSTTSREA